MKQLCDTSRGKVWGQYNPVWLHLTNGTYLHIIQKILTYALGHDNHILSNRCLTICTASRIRAKAYIAASLSQNNKL